MRFTFLKSLRARETRLEKGTLPFFRTASPEQNPYGENSAPSLKKNPREKGNIYIFWR